MNLSELRALGSKIGLHETPFDLEKDYETNLISFIREYLEIYQTHENLINPERILGIKDLRDTQEAIPEIKTENQEYLPEIEELPSQPIALLVVIKKDIDTNSWLVEEYGTNQEYTLRFYFDLEYLSGPPAVGQIIEVQGKLINGNIIQVSSPDKLIPAGWLEEKK
ncbi:MAG: hypothetical protein KGZ94_14000 [Clostridia bacterium]|nr:hypothetical protein [Clostridia bacterium]